MGLDGTEILRYELFVVVVKSEGRESKHDESATDKALKTGVAAEAISREREREKGFGGGVRIRGGEDEGGLLEHRENEVRVAVRYKRDFRWYKGQMGWTFEIMDQTKLSS